MVKEWNLITTRDRGLMCRSGCLIHNGIYSIRVSRVSRVGRVSVMVSVRDSVK